MKGPSYRLRLQLRVQSKTAPDSLIIFFLLIEHFAHEGELWLYFRDNHPLCEGHEEVKPFSLLLQQSPWRRTPPSEGEDKSHRIGGGERGACVGKGTDAYLTGRHIRTHAF